MILRRRHSVPKPEDLRAEYKAAQQHVVALSSSVFQSVAIIVGGSFAALALLLDLKVDTRRVAAAITTLALGAVLVIEVWRYNWNRHKVVIFNHATRMREIERLRGMRKNIHMYLLTIPKDRRTCVDEWKWLSEREQDRFPKPYEELPKLPWYRHSTKGWDVLQATASMVQIGWLLMIAYAWSQAEDWP